MTTKTGSRRSAIEGEPEGQGHDVRSNIKDIIEEAKKLGEWPDIEALKKQSDPTLIHVLIEIENTIRHLSSLYADSGITEDKKKELDKFIQQADTRAMAILTILRNR